MHSICYSFIWQKNAVALHENKVQALGRYLGWKMLEKKKVQCNAVFFKDAIILIFRFLFAEKKKACKY